MEDFQQYPAKPDLTLSPHLLNYGQRRSNKSCSGLSLLPQENDEGSIEYKLRICPGEGRFHQLVTQLKFRLSEGHGSCLYYIGVEDNGHPAGLPLLELKDSFEVLCSMAREVGASAELVHNLPGTIPGHLYAIIRITQAQSSSDIAAVDLRIAVLGNVDGGKSTLVGVLTTGESGEPLLDNGRGSARTTVHKHKHEIESGRTSSISHQILGYDNEGKNVNYDYPVPDFGPGDIALTSQMVLRFFDLGGHEKYLKTALFGMTALFPDYAMICVCAVSGISWVTREHLAIALALGVPPFLVLTKADLVSEDRLESIANEIKQLAMAAFKSAGMEYTRDTFATIIHDEDKANVFARINNSFKLPIFVVSSVTGQGLKVLHAFLRHLKPTSLTRSVPIMDTMMTQYQIDAIFEVYGVGTVLSGTLLSGKIRIGDTLLIGPDEIGKFRHVRVKEIQRAQVEVDAVSPGQHATIAIDLITETSTHIDNDCISTATTARPPLSQLTEVRGIGKELAIQPNNPPSTPNLEVLGTSWDASARLQHSNGAVSSPEEALFGRMESGAAPCLCKGTVLLDPLLPDIKATWEFEAVVVLLGGKWLTRGLISASHPSQGECSLVTHGTSGSKSGGGSGKGRPRLQRKKSGLSSYTVHCGSIRQSATITEIQELPIEEHGENEVVKQAMAAAGVVDEPGCSAGERFGCLACIRLSFGRPQFLIPCSRIVIHDKSNGRIAGAGYVI